MFVSSLLRRPDVDNKRGGEKESNEKKWNGPTERRHFKMAKTNSQRDSKWPTRL
jgi:hypothetical protein